MNLLEELGYRFNEETLREAFQEAGQSLSAETCKWYQAAAPYIVMAYEQGQEGQALSSIFPFLEKAEGYAKMVLHGCDTMEVSTRAGTLPRTEEILL